MTDSSGGGLSKIVLSVDDFLNCGWKEALDAADIHHYSTMHVAFEEAARRAFEAGREAEGKVLRLFSDACSMMFDFPTNKTHPFKPNAKVYRGGQCYRSPLSEDFSDSDLKFLAEIARLEEMDDPRLKARLSDIVWIEKRPAGISYHEHALNAIKNYRAVPLDPKHPSSDAKDCWIRAVELSHMLNKKKILIEIESDFINLLDSIQPPDAYFAIVLTDILESTDLGKSHAYKVAEKLETLSSQAKPSATIANWYEKASNWYRAAGRQDQSIDMIVKWAECFANDADSHASSGGHPVAVGYYQQAIEIYKSIRRSEREARQLDRRIEEIRELLVSSQNKIQDGMTTISVDIGVGDIAKAAREAVQGKSRSEALRAFINLGAGIDKEHFRKRAIEQINNHPSLRLLPRTYVSPDGRKVADGSAPDDLLSGDGGAVIKEQMIQMFNTHVGVFALGGILPALEVLHLEHRFTAADFISIARHSFNIPNDRSLLYGKALEAGYNCDFMTSVHLLAPQIENITRHLLKESGAQTTFVNKNKRHVETENSLSSLIGMNETVDIFGKNLHFEIEALFCSQLGANLRNKVAHGLLDDESAQSVYCVYAWWFGLRLAFTNLVNERLDSLLSDFDEASLHDEIDTGESVGREA